MLPAISLIAGNAFSQTEFIENKGQWDKQVTFMTNAGNGAFFLNKNGFTVLQHDAKELQNLVHHTHMLTPAASHFETTLIPSHAYSVQFVR